MDVVFEVQGGSTFSIEVDFFDTVLETKEKVQKHKGIPVSRQTFVFEGQILPDNGHVASYVFLQDSSIQILLAPEETSPPPPLRPTSIVLNVKIPSSKWHVPLLMDVNDTVLRLKERIQAIVAEPVNRLLLHATGTELLHDNHQLLRDCPVSENSVIDVTFKPSPPTASAAKAVAGSSKGEGSKKPVAGGIKGEGSKKAVASGSKGEGSEDAVAGGGKREGSKKLMVNVLPMRGTEKIAVEINESDNVGELREELSKLQQSVKFDLPEEYFFIHKQEVMDDDRPFRWHDVKEGDTIEIFRGRVTKTSP